MANTLAIGAPGEDSDATGINGDQTDTLLHDSTLLQVGAAYVFTRNARGAWSQQAYVKASNAGRLDHFGTSLSLSADGSVLAVGASGKGGLRRSLHIYSGYSRNLEPTSLY